MSAVLPGDAAINGGLSVRTVYFMLRIRKQGEYNASTEIGGSTRARAEFDYAVKALGDSTFVIPRDLKAEGMYDQWVASRRADDRGIWDSVLAAGPPHRHRPSAYEAVRFRPEWDRPSDAKTASDTKAATASKATVRPTWGDIYAAGMVGTRDHVLPCRLGGGPSNVERFVARQRKARLLLEEMD